MRRLFLTAKSQPRERNVESYVADRTFFRTQVRSEGNLASSAVGGVSRECLDAGRCSVRSADAPIWV